MQATSEIKVPGHPWSSIKGTAEGFSENNATKWTSYFLESSSVIEPMKCGKEFISLSCLRLTTSELARQTAEAELTSQTHAATCSWLLLTTFDWCRIGGLLGNSRKSTDQCGSVWEVFGISPSHLEEWQFQMAWRCLSLPLAMLNMSLTSSYSVHVWKMGKRSRRISSHLRSCLSHAEGWCS